MPLSFSPISISDFSLFTSEHYKSILKYIFQDKLEHLNSRTYNTIVKFDENNANILLYTPQHELRMYIRKLPNGYYETHRTIGSHISTYTDIDLDLVKVHIETLIQFWDDQTIF